MSEAVDFDAIDFSLPPRFTVLRPLMRVLGVPDLLALLRARGGIPLKLPMTPGGPLVDMLGAAKVEALLREFGPGTTLQLPVPDKIEAKIRNAAIVAEHAAGASYADLALRYRLTMRQVIYIAKSSPAPQQAQTQTQTDLFTHAGSKS